MTIKKTTRTRLNGYAGIAIATLLTPAGKVISTAVAAASVVGVLSTSDQPPAHEQIRFDPAAAAAATVMAMPIALPPIINTDLPSVTATASASADAALAEAMTQSHPLSGRSDAPNHTGNPGGFGQPANHGFMGSAPSKAKAKSSPDSKPVGKNPERVFPVMPPTTKTTEIDPDCKPVNGAKRNNEEAPADQPDATDATGSTECKSDKDKLAEANTPDGQSTEPNVPVVVASAADPEVIQDALPPLKSSDDRLTPDDIASSNAPETFSPVLHDPDMNPDGALTTSAPPASPALHESLPSPVDPLTGFALPIILASPIPVGLAGDEAGQNVPVSGIAAAPIPEPATMSLLALGLLGLSWMSRKKWVSLASK